MIHKEFVKILAFCYVTVLSEFGEESDPLFVGLIHQFLKEDRFTEIQLNESLDTMESYLKEIAEYCIYKEIYSRVSH